jgi:hypothetical protein
MPASARSCLAEGRNRRGPYYRRARRDSGRGEPSHARFRPRSYPFHLGLAHGHNGRHRLLACPGHSRPRPGACVALSDQEMGRRRPWRRQLYLALSGAAVPTVRSWIMMSIVDRRHAGPASSDDAQCSSRRPAILVVAPESLFDPSFEMSFAAVVGLVALYEWLSKRRREQLSDVSPAWQALRRGWALAAGAALTTLVAGTGHRAFRGLPLPPHDALRALCHAAPRQLFDHADGDVEPGRNAVRPRSVAAPRHGLRHRSDGCNGTMGGVLARRRLDPTAHFRHRPGPGRVGDVVGLSLADADARLA